MEGTTEGPKELKSSEKFRADDADVELRTKEYLIILSYKTVPDSSSTRPISLSEALSSMFESNALHSNHLNTGDETKRIEIELPESTSQLDSVLPFFYPELREKVEVEQRLLSATSTSNLIQQLEAFDKYEALFVIYAFATHFNLGDLQSAAEVGLLEAVGAMGNFDSMTEVSTENFGFLAPSIPPLLLIEGQRKTPTDAWRYRFVWVLKFNKIMVRLAKIGEYHSKQHKLICNLSVSCDHPEKVECHKAQIFQWRKIRKVGTSQAIKVELATISDAQVMCKRCQDDVHKRGQLFVEWLVRLEKQSAPGSILP
ncbi:hypothetical protein T439DRAFT_337003 [Meredithblackwellia eburnea MCA 4105]